MNIRRGTDNKRLAKLNHYQLLYSTLKPWHLHNYCKTWQFTEQQPIHRQRNNAADAKSSCHVWIKSSTANEQCNTQRSVRSTTDGMLYTNDNDDNDVKLTFTFISRSTTTRQLQSTPDRSSLPTCLCVSTVQSLWVFAVASLPVPHPTMYDTLLPHPVYFSLLQ